MNSKKYFFISLFLVIIIGSIVYKKSLALPPNEDKAKIKVRDHTLTNDEINTELNAEPEPDVEPEPEKEAESEKEPEPEKEPVIISSLKDKIICIDPGHQESGNNNHEPIGPGSKSTKPKVSSGTKGVATGKWEYELNLEVALLLKEALSEKGAVVHMVRETNQVDISNAERAQLANDVNADLSLRIHADSAGDSSAKGYSILVPGGDFVSESIISKSRDIAEHVDLSLGKNISPPSRGLISRNDLTGFNWTKVPAILIEMGFMSNPDEDKLMSTNEFQTNFVEGVIQGLESYY